jgi:uncharacterized protein RhaS with RHS repeats
MGVRGYDPALGRFLSVDPIRGGSANDYDYVTGDPINSYDLDGRFAFVIAIPFIAGALVKAFAVVVTVAALGATAMAIDSGVKAYHARKRSAPSVTAQTQAEARILSQRAANSGGPNCKWRGLCKKRDHYHVDRKKGSTITTRHYYWKD